MLPDPVQGGEIEERNMSWRYREAVIAARFGLTSMRNHRPRWLNAVALTAAVSAANGGFCRTALFGVCPTRTRWPAISLAPTRSSIIYIAEPSCGDSG